MRQVILDCFNDFFFDLLFSRLFGFLEYLEVGLRGLAAPCLGLKVFKTDLTCFFGLAMVLVADKSRAGFLNILVDLVVFSVRFCCLFDLSNPRLVICEDLNVILFQ